MKYIFLINSFGLKNEVTKLISIIRGVSKNLNLDYRIEVNSPQRSIEKIIDSYKDSKNIFVAIGGDGTINRTLNSIVNTNNILSYIPLGTGNDFYRSNKEILSDGVNSIDLVKINEKYFINVACFGVDADIANTADIIHSKIIPKNQRYNISMIYNFLNYKARNLFVTIDDKVYNADFTTVAVCNSRYYGGGYKIAPNASLNDGLVDVYLVDEVSKIKSAFLISGMKKKLHEKSKHVKKIQTKKVLIESKNIITCNIDGESMSSNKFDIEVIPNGIEVNYNQRLIDEVLTLKLKK